MLEWLSALDGNILLWIQEFLRVDLLNAVLSFYTKLGDSGLAWIAVSVIMLIFPKTRRAGLLALLAMALGFLCTNVVLKHLVARPRPWLVVEGLTFLVVEPDPNSFPSGHATCAFAAGGAWWRTQTRRWARVTGLVLAAVMAFSRLYVGVHFPSDVLVGCLVGFGCSQLVWLLWRRFRPEQDAPELT